MKKILNLALLAMFFVGCEKNESTQKGSSDGSVVFQAKIDGKSRTIGDAWEVNDKIGIFANGDETASNLHYNVTATSGKMEAVSNENKIYPYDNDEVTYIAYYPYQSNMTNDIYNINVADQNDLGAIDLLRATATATATATGVSAPIALTFEHQLSKLHLKLIPGEGINQEQLVNVTVKVIGMSTTGTYNIRTKEIRPTTTATGDISMKVTNSLTEASAEAILIPHDNVPIKLHFTLADNSITFKTSLNKALSAGMTHNYDITITKRLP